jgi:hypothetical protein
MPMPRNARLDACLPMAGTGCMTQCDYPGGERRRVQARSLFFYWAVSELGMSVTELARRFEQRPSTVTYECRRGEQMAIKQNYQLISNKH